MYVSDFVDAHDETTPKFPLELVLCNAKEGGCGLLQLKHSVSHEVMYRNYWYRSGMNKTMTDELNGIAQRVKELVHVKEGDYVIDIGANDGTLLRGYKTDGLHTIGYEPARNLQQYNSIGTTKVFEDFFSAGPWNKEFPGKKAKAITAIAMFYDLENPNSFVADVASSLDNDGVFIIQMSYLPLMLTTNEVGNICHEHLEYYSLFSLENLLKRHGLEVFDVELNDINGGSFRVYIRHKGKGEKIAVPFVAHTKVAAMRAYEESLGLNEKKVYEEFVQRIEKIKAQLVDFIKKQKQEGKKVYAYGASTKGNTLLQFCGLDHTLIAGAAERNPDKWGKKTVGTLIPIVSEEDARKAQPTHFLVLPWHFISEFKTREQEYLKNGGTFIVPMPDFKIITHES
jgi:hypothetical protein